MADQVQPNIVARPVGRESVLTVVGAQAGARGPWSFVTGIPNPGLDMVGPPPQYLSVAAWAAWTVVTVVGVAYRGNIALEDITVDFEVESVELPNAIGFGVRELVTLKGRITESERVRLERASRFCPVGQALTKGSMHVEDEVRWASGDVAAIPAGLETLPRLDGALPAIPSGSVHGQYLLDTKEYDDAGTMEHEGEAKIAVSCENLTRTGRWTLLGGHSSDGWVPPPFPLAHGGWAASTASTLSRLLPHVNDGDSLSVELYIAAGGNRGESQSNAAEGVVAHRQVSRRIMVPGSPSTTPIETVQAALQRDPISLAYLNGGVLLHDEVVVES